jgi:nucleoside-diphosphate-sugar epimerase
MMIASIYNTIGARNQQRQTPRARRFLREQPGDPRSAGRRKSRYDGRAPHWKEMRSMRVTIISGTGHIGSYLTPMLVKAGHSVTCVCRNLRQPYREDESWSSIAYLRLDRAREEQAGSFGRRIAELRADAVIDLTCYTLQSAEQLTQALQGCTGHLLHCGTIWVHGHSISVPTTESQPREPLGDYGQRKAAIEHWLLQQSNAGALPVTILHPGHLVGPGWPPINPQGNFNTGVFAALMHGAEVQLPNSEWRQSIMCTPRMWHKHSCWRWNVGRRQRVHSFHVVSASALTLRGYAEQMAAWLHQPARLRFLPWEEWKQGVSSKDAATTEDHIRHSPNCSIQKARSVLGYGPRYTSIEAVQEAVNWLTQHGVIS